MADAFSDVTDETESDIELSDNVASDFLEYFRGAVVGHEQEGWLMTLGLVSGYGYGDDFHINVIGKGEPGSGKSLTKNTTEALVIDRDKYTKTDASSNAILDSPEWDLSLVAPLDEYDKIDSAIVEVLKSSNPEDGGYAKDRNVENPDAVGGYEPVEVSAEANPWVILYAPSSKKGGINDELEDRALVLYFSNDRTTRRAIGRKEFGHSEIDSSKYDDEYIYDAHEVKTALRSHLSDLPTQTSYGENDDGEEYVAARSGAAAAYIPRWVWYCVEPVFSIDEDHTNRVYGIISNLIKSSAIANHHARRTRETEVYVDEDSEETETIEQYVAEPQDVWNVMMCLESLLSTTHQLTPLKRHILDAVDATEPLAASDGTTVSKVQEWLDGNDIPHPSRSTLKDRMDELAEDYYLQRWKSTAGPKGQADAYEKHDDGALQPPRVENLSKYADQDGVDLNEDCVECNVDDPFADVWDPLREQPAKETQSYFEAQFSGGAKDEDTMVAAMGPDPNEEERKPEPVDPRDDPEDGDSSLDDFTASSDEAASDSRHRDGDGFGDDGEGGSSESDPKGSSGENTTPETDLSPDSPPERQSDQWVLEHIRENAGEVFAGNHTAAHYVGAVATEKTVDTADTDGTVLDPDHELWSCSQFTDDRVITVDDARKELQEAFDRLRHNEWVTLDSGSAPPAMAQLVTADESG